LSASSQREKSHRYAKSDTKKALDLARKIDDAWYKSQALAWAARFAEKESDVLKIAKESAMVSKSCKDQYQQSAVRAWEIVALADRGYNDEAISSLSEALQIAKSAEPPSSRSEALTRLFSAACYINMDEAQIVHQIICARCPEDEHWRCKRAKKYTKEIIDGKYVPRKFFW